MRASRTCALGFSERPANCAGTSGVSRFSRMEFPGMPGVCDCAGFISGSRWSSPMMWPSASPNGVGTPNEMDFAAQYPACLCPCQRFACHLAANTRMTRGQDGSLLLSCRTLSFPTECRFSPTLSARHASPCVAAMVSRFPFQLRQPPLQLRHFAPQFRQPRQVG